jgi:hypothetical protein
VHTELGSILPGFYSCFAPLTGAFIQSFFRARGLVEIFWRGQLDFHGTLHSADNPGFTRFGTSIQVTTTGVNAMKKVWKVEELAQSGHNIHHLTPKSAARITTVQDRIQNAQAHTVSPPHPIVCGDCTLYSQAVKKRKTRA